MVTKQAELTMENKMHDAVHKASVYANDAKGYAMEQKINVEGMVKEHPWAFVLGSFAGGVIVGTLLAKRD